MRIGFIGTGTMGTPIAGCLVAAGHRLTVYDLRREATETLRQQGAAIGETPRALAEASEIVFTSLPGPNEVEAAALDPETGLLAGLADSGGYIHLTTNAPKTIPRLSAARAPWGAGSAGRCSSASSRRNCTSRRRREAGGRKALRS